MIPSGQINYSNFEHLNIPDRELNVNKFTEKIRYFIFLLDLMKSC